ncbi:uncharacterized protein LOC123558454 [Mercenaria mercenaria]|uniref:uncharacterized protein LOC123558454 n=1 Tax=Mercenaria mercenaria TaxID=6596 RepID=UPI00234F07BB|nr:uncharacterized protein LOC123558454 [Mercenaria mercenaria]
MGNDCTGSKPLTESQSGGPQKDGQPVHAKESGHHRYAAQGSHGHAVKGRHHGQPNEGMSGNSRNDQYVPEWQHSKGGQYRYTTNGQNRRPEGGRYLQGNSSEERNALELLRQENESLKITIDKLKNKSNSEITKAWDDMRERCKEAMVKKENELRLLQDKTDRRYQEIIQGKNRQIETFRQDLNKIQKERDNLMTRYSALAGSKLTDGNANIADLSDENRPTKLAEQYAELYDNEWTDAFTVLTADGTRTNDDVCRILAEAFCIIYSTTRKEAHSDLENLTKSMKSFLKTDELPSEMLKTIKDRRKMEPGRYLKNIRELYSDDMGKILSSEEQKYVSQFLQKSVDLCWLMAVQDPPLYVDTNLSRMDDKFDTNQFKPYTATGKFIDFVVWPTLYLFEEGNMLSKGIAQGKKIRRKSQQYDNIGINRDTAKNDLKSPTLSSPVSFVQTTEENSTSLSGAKHDKNGNDYAVVSQYQGKLGSSVGHQGQNLNCSQNAGENMSPRGEGKKDSISVSRENESASTPGPATTDEPNSRPKSYASASHSPTTKPTKTTYKAWAAESTETEITKEVTLDIQEKNVTSIKI